MASPLLGYNNNFRHKNRVFHIQTEDSGVKHPHIITHLFADGGRIVKSVKTSYAEYVGADRMREIVKEMMKQQHKAMIIALRDGQFDQIIDTPGSAPPGRGSDVAPAPSVPPAGVVALATPPPVSILEASDATDPSDAPVEERSPDTHRVADAEPELTLDIDALERAAAAADPPAGSMERPSELPPPPENLFREKTATGGPRQTDTLRPPSRRGGARSLPPPLPGPPRAPAIGSGSSADSGQRYANVRPPAIFGRAKPLARKGVFGEDVISDKSLDEVILGYLSEDLDADNDRNE